MHPRYSTLIRIGIGAALVLIVVRMIIELTGSPMAELGELYPPPGDDYLFELQRLAEGKHRTAGGALIRPDVAQELLDGEVRWLRGETALQRWMDATFPPRS